MKICLDAGHGGRDPGAIGFGLQEKDISLNIVLEINKILNENNIGTVLTRNIDIELGKTEQEDLKERVNIANNAKVDLFLSIHCNAFNQKAYGFEVYHFPSSDNGKVLAQKVHDQVIKMPGLVRADRGIVKRQNLAVLRRTDMPSILIECAFIDEKTDNEILKTKQNEFAAAISRGILDYLGISEKIKSAEINENNKPSEWAKEAWEFTKKENLLDGTRPKENVTRQELALVLMKLKS